MYVIILVKILYFGKGKEKMQNELKNMIGTDETILYEGKPNKKCFIFESIFNPLLPISIIWAMIDFFILSQNISTFMIPFILLHLMPVWIYLVGVIFSFRKYKNTYYIVTDHGVYISSGIFTMTLQSKTFAELSRVDLHRGIFDQVFNVGDILITTDQITRKNTPAVLNISSISNYSEVYQLIKKLQKDIYSDIMYPNDLRPQENHGYRTKYKG